MTHSLARREPAARRRRPSQRPFLTDPAISAIDMITYAGTFASPARAESPAEAATFARMEQRT